MLSLIAEINKIRETSLNMFKNNENRSLIFNTQRNNKIGLVDCNRDGPSKPEMFFLSSTFGSCSVLTTDHVLFEFPKRRQLNNTNFCLEIQYRNHNNRNSCAWYTKDMTLYNVLKNNWLILEREEIKIVYSENSFISNVKQFYFKSA